MQTKKKSLTILIVVLVVAGIVAGLKAFSGDSATTVDDKTNEVTPSALADATADSTAEPQATTDIVRNEPTELTDQNPNLDADKVVEPGTAGLLSMKQNQVLALNWSEDGSNAGTTGDTVNIYKTDAGLLVIKPLFVWNSEVGETMELTIDGEESTYECVFADYTMLNDGNNYVLSSDESVLIEQASYGQVVIISNGQASYWNLAN